MQYVNRGEEDDLPLFVIANNTFKENLQRPVITICQYTQVK